MIIIIIIFTGCWRRRRDARTAWSAKQISCRRRVFLTTTPQDKNRSRSLHPTDRIWQAPLTVLSRLVRERRSRDTCPLVNVWHRGIVTDCMSYTYSRTVQREWKTLPQRFLWQYFLKYWGTIEILRILFNHFARAYRVFIYLRKTTNFYPVIFNSDEVMPYWVRSSSDFLHFTIMQKMRYLCSSRAMTDRHKKRMMYRTRLSSAYGC